VWKYFVLSDDKSKTTCELCKIELSYKGGTTSSMRTHLTKVHKMSDSDVENELVFPRQATMSAYMKNKNQPLSSQKQEAVTRKIPLMCALDLRPVSIVEGRGFNMLCEEMLPSYKVPCRKTVKRYLQKLYEEEQNKMVHHEKGNISMTTGPVCHRSVTGHFISNEWKLENFNLATRVMHDRHT
jgi:hypothetical protein